MPITTTASVTDNTMNHSNMVFGENENSAASSAEVQGEEAQRNARTLKNGGRKSGAEFFKKHTKSVRSFFTFSKPAVVPVDNRQLVMTEVEKLNNKQITRELNGGIIRAFKTNVQHAICESTSLARKFSEKTDRSPESVGTGTLVPLNLTFINLYNKALVEKYKEHRAENKSKVEALVHAHKDAFADAAYKISERHGMENVDEYTEVICQFEFGNVEKIMLSGLKDEALEASLYDEKILPNRLELTLKTANPTPDAKSTADATAQTASGVAEPQQKSESVIQSSHDAPENGLPQTDGDISIVAIWNPRFSSAKFLADKQSPDHGEVKTATTDSVSETPENPAPRSGDTIALPAAPFTAPQEFALDKADENNNVSEQAATSEPVISKEVVIANDGEDVPKENDADHGTRLERAADNKGSIFYWDKRNPEAKNPRKRISNVISDIVGSLTRGLPGKKYPVIENPTYKKAAAKEAMTASPVENNNDVQNRAAAGSIGARLDDVAVENNGKAIEQSDHTEALETGKPAAKKRRNKSMFDKMKGFSFSSKKNKAQVSQSRWYDEDFQANDRMVTAQQSSSEYKAMHGTIAKAWEKAKSTCMNFHAEENGKNNVSHVVDDMEIVYKTSYDYAYGHARGAAEDSVPTVMLSAQKSALLDLKKYRDQIPQEQLRDVADTAINIFGNEIQKISVEFVGSDSDNGDASRSIPVIKPTDHVVIAALKDFQSKKVATATADSRPALPSLQQGMRELYDPAPTIFTIPPQKPPRNGNQVEKPVRGNFSRSSSVSVDDSEGESGYESGDSAILSVGMRDDNASEGVKNNAPAPKKKRR